MKTVDAVFMPKMQGISWSPQGAVSLQSGQFPVLPGIFPDPRGECRA